MFYIYKSNFLSGSVAKRMQRDQVRVLVRELESTCFNCDPNKFLKNRQLPWCPVVRTQWFCHMGHRFNPGPGTQILHALSPKIITINYRENSLAPSDFHFPGPLLGGLLQLVTWCVYYPRMFSCVCLCPSARWLLSFLTFARFPFEHLEDS